jgi:hypothetical protein
MASFRRLRTGKSAVLLAILTTVLDGRNGNCISNLRSDSEQRATSTGTSRPSG